MRHASGAQVVGAAAALMCERRVCAGDDPLEPAEELLGGTARVPHFACCGFSEYLSRGTELDETADKAAL
jgi:hypothetical protein